jgi:hypothetical protein
MLSDSKFVMVIFESRSTLKLYKCHESYLKDVLEVSRA